MATHDKEPQRLEVTVSDPNTNETLSIGDYFVGMRCAASGPSKRISISDITRDGRTLKTKVAD